MTIFLLLFLIIFVTILNGDSIAKPMSRFSTIGEIYGILYTIGIYYSASSDSSHPDLSTKPDLSTLFFGNENVTNRVSGGFQKTK